MSFCVADVMNQIRMKGVQLWTENGQLRYRAPRGVLTGQEFAQLRASRDEIVALLDGAARDFTEASNDDRHQPRLVPMAFSQIAHWNLYRLNLRQAIRQIASALRLNGKLDIEVLQHSFAEVVRRHDALRTRIVVVDGVPTQLISNRAEGGIVLDDLTALEPEEVEEEVGRRIERLIMEPIDPSLGPLCGLRLLRIGPEEHVLLAAMEHMISDAFSMGVFLRELFSAYAQLIRGQRVQLPEVSMQFTDFAVSQRRTLEVWRARHEPYWSERLAGLQRLKFPEDRRAKLAGQAGWGIVPFSITPAMKMRLSEWCRLRRTTLVMSVFTAYVAVALRWCAATHAIFQYQTDGRVDHRIAHSIGYFASTLFLRVELGSTDSFVTFIRSVTEEYCRAYEHADASWMESNEPRPEIAKSSCFNWVSPNGARELTVIAGATDALKCTPVTFEHPMLKTLERDNEPVALLFEEEQAVEGGIYFPRDRFTPESMERLVRNLQLFLETMLERPDQCIARIELVL